MLKKKIKFEDYDGEEVEETFYFNLSEPELLEMEVEHRGGMAKIIQFIVDTNDHKKLLETFKMLIMMSYGVRSEDGRRFIKNDQVRDEFEQTAAYSALYMELCTNDEAAVVFLNGILPKRMQGTITIDAVKKQMTKIEGRPAAVSSAPLPPTAKG